MENKTVKENDLPYWQETQNCLQPLIKKPKLYEKYLKKPPFLYIKHIVMNLMQSTGFPEGLFDASLLDRNIKDKQEKLQFLELLVACTELVNIRPISVNSKKILAGMQPERTNKMLQELAAAAIKTRDNQIDLPSIVDRAKKEGRMPRQMRGLSSPAQGPTIKRIIDKRRHSSPNLQGLAGRTLPDFTNPNPNNNRPKLPSHTRNSSRGGRKSRPMSPGPSRTARGKYFPQNSSSPSRSFSSYNNGGGRNSPRVRSPTKGRPFDFTPPDEKKHSYGPLYGRTVGVMSGKNLRQQVDHQNGYPRHNFGTAPASRRRNQKHIRPQIPFSNHNLPSFDFREGDLESPADEPHVGSAPVTESSSPDTGDSVRRSGSSRVSGEIDDRDLPILEGNPDQGRPQVIRQGSQEPIPQPGGHYAGAMNHPHSHSRPGSQPGSRPESPRNISNVGRVHIRQPSNPLASEEDDPRTNGMPQTDEEMIAKTQQLLGSLIEKPKLRPQLLKRPPVRFLHDIVKNVIKATGYMDGIFDPEELDYRKVKKDKKVKLNFLTKFVLCVQFSSNRSLSVSARKMMAGEEHEKNTNLLLQCLAENASRNDLDMQQIRRRIDDYIQRRPSYKSSLNAIDFAKEKHRIKKQRESSSAYASPADSPRSSGPPLDRQHSNSSPIGGSSPSQNSSHHSRQFSGASHSSQGSYGSVEDFPKRGTSSDDSFRKSPSRSDSRRIVSPSRTPSRKSSNSDGPNSHLPINKKRRSHEKENNIVNPQTSPSTHNRSSSHSSQRHHQQQHQAPRASSPPPASYPPTNHPIPTSKTFSHESYDNIRPQTARAGPSPLKTNEIASESEETASKRPKSKPEMKTRLKRFFGR